MKIEILNDVGQKTIMNAVFHPTKVFGSFFIVFTSFPIRHFILCFNFLFIPFEVLELFKLIAIPNKFDARPKQISLAFFSVLIF